MTQTSLQELKHWIEEEYTQNGRIRLAAIASKIKSLEDINKKEIKEAWHDGYMLGQNGLIIEEYSNSEGYYNHTYGSR
jgi:hypothetical protein